MPKRISAFGIINPLSPPPCQTVKRLWSRLIHNMENCKIGSLQILEV